jgi:hypothetical protein
MVNLIDDNEFKVSVIKDLEYIKAKLNNGITAKQEDHERRLRFLEKGFYIAVGAIALLEIFLKIFWK